MQKAYEPQKYEDKIYHQWEKSGFFNPDVCITKGVCDENARPFTIVLPPPNATGSLHIGHAMMLAIEDLMIARGRNQADTGLISSAIDILQKALEPMEWVEKDGVLTCGLFTIVPYNDEFEFTKIRAMLQIENSNHINCVSIEEAKAEAERIRRCM